MEIKNGVSAVTRIYKPGEVRDFELRDILGAIQTGYFCGQDLRGITTKIQAEPDHDKQNVLKYWNLPVALFNGTFSYKNTGSLKIYSNFTAIDFDGFQNKEEMDNARKALMQRNYIYSIFTTPSGHGLKAIVIHDNNDSGCHEELFTQLLALFNLPTDPSVIDLARGNYICYDPNIYLNPNCVPFHFVHNPNYVPKFKAYTGASKAGTPHDIGMLRWLLSMKHPIGNKSDESIINILNSHWKKQPDRWAKGNRKNSVFKSATELCLAGVNVDKALNYLVKAYTAVGLGENEIEYQTMRGYQNNVASYGIRRSKYDNYGKKKS